jgi:hypothetical protein
MRAHPDDRIGFDWIYPVRIVCGTLGENLSSSSCPELSRIQDRYASHVADVLIAAFVEKLDLQSQMAIFC